MVDDSKINQLVVKKILEPLGYKIEAAMDGQSALRFLIESPTLPDVMLLDIVRPRSRRSAPPMQHIPSTRIRLRVPSSSRSRLRPPTRAVPQRNHPARADPLRLAFSRSCRGFPASRCARACARSGPSPASPSSS